MVKKKASLHTSVMLMGLMCVKLFAISYFLQGPLNRGVVYFVFLSVQSEHGRGDRNLITGSAFLSKVNQLWST